MGRDGAGVGTMDGGSTGHRNRVHNENKGLKPKF